ncbi:MAG: hypothetical protein PHV13_05310, partial [Candidatus ainarchaeum sp.]|nr:hypothetical protein [Candidatus ainarchaeum sp.]
MRMNLAARNMKIVLQRERGVPYDKTIAPDITHQRKHQVFARHSLLTEDLQKDGLKGHGLDTRSAHVLYKILSSRTLGCLRQWVAENPDWKNQVRLTPGGSTAIANRIEAFLKKNNPPASIGRLYKGLGIRASNCMRVVCPGFGQMPEEKLAAWFAENPLWLPIARKTGNFGKKTETEITVFVIRHNLARPSLAPPMDVYGLLKDLVLSNPSHPKDLSRTSMRQWFGGNPNWRETLYLEYSYRDPGLLRRVERYIFSEGLATMPALTEDERDGRITALHQKGVKYRAVARIYGITPAYWRTL